MACIVPVCSQVITFLIADYNKNCVFISCAVAQFSGVFWLFSLMASSCNSVVLQTSAEVWGQLVPWLCGFVTHCHQLGQCLRLTLSSECRDQACCFHIAAAVLCSCSAASPVPSNPRIVHLGCSGPLPCCGSITLTPCTHQCSCFPA